MTDYGEDFHGVDDIDSTLSLSTGRVAVAEAVACRLLTSWLWYDKTYGYDLRRLLNAPVNAAVLRQRIVSEVKKDERVADARAVVTVVGDTLIIEVFAVGAAGPFRFVLSVSALKAEILEVT